MDSICSNYLLFDFILVSISKLFLIWIFNDIITFFVAIIVGDFTRILLIFFSYKLFYIFAFRKNLSYIITNS